MRVNETLLQILKKIFKCNSPRRDRFIQYDYYEDREKY